MYIFLYHKHLSGAEFIPSTGTRGTTILDPCPEIKRVIAQVREIRTQNTRTAG